MLINKATAQVEGANEATIRESRGLEVDSGVRHPSKRAWRRTEGEVRTDICSLEAMRQLGQQVLVMPSMPLS